MAGPEVSKALNRGESAERYHAQMSSRGILGGDDVRLAWRGPSIYESRTLTSDTDSTCNLTNLCKWVLCSLVQF